MYKIAVRKIMAIVKSQYEKYTEMQEVINRTREWKHTLWTFFLWKKAEGRSARVPLWRLSRTTSGTRTADLGPLFESGQS